MSETTVRSVMHTDVRTVDPNADLLDARRAQQAERIRHLPVVDEDGQLVGIISQRDMFHRGLIRALGYGDHAQEALASNLPVKEVMVNDVITIGPNASLREAARLMLHQRVGCLPVVDGGELIGIVSESDLLRWLAGDDA